MPGSSTDGVVPAPLRRAGAAGLVGEAQSRWVAAIEWLQRNLFSSWSNALLTMIVVALAAVVLPPLLRWMITHAVVSGASRAACHPEGACWTFIRIRLPTFFYGHYPVAQRWRVDLAGLLLVAFAAPVIRENTRHRWLWVLLLLALFPALAGVLLVGGLSGLPSVDTGLWGGLMLNVIISFVTVAGALPLGVLLALGRRSVLPIVRTLSVSYIERRC